MHIKVLLISANTEQGFIIPLPIGLNRIYAAVLKSGHEVKLIDLMAEKDWPSALKEAITSFEPEIIGVSVRNVDDQNMGNPRFLLDLVKKIIACCRNLSSVPIVLGGAGYSIFPESVLDYLEADMGIQGEGELSFPMLLNHLACGKSLSHVPGLYLRGAGLQGKRVFEKNLDEFLIPGPEILSASIQRREDFWVPLQTRRGCPMACSYCSTSIIEGNSIRKRPTDSVIKEISVYMAAGFQKFYFVDSTFNLPENYAKEICRKIIESRLTISWRCIIYPRRINEELVHLMARAGCMEVSLGFESGCKEILRKMNKKYSPEEMRRTSEMLRDAGIRRMGFLLLGGPGETKSSVLESLEFADSLNLDSLKITVGIRIYPGTALAAAAIKEGLISPEDNLLFPSFYLAPDLREWLYETVHLWMKKQPNWLF